MRLPGWCERCHRVRQVRVSGGGMARLAAGHTAVGVCSDCEKRDEDKRREANRARR